MTLLERIQRIEAERHMPTNVQPMRAPKERRAEPRWMEWTRENEKRGADLSGYLKDVA